MFPCLSLNDPEVLGYLEIQSLVLMVFGIVRQDVTTKTNPKNTIFLITNSLLIICSAAQYHDFRIYAPGAYISNISLRMNPFKLVCQGP